MRGYCSLVLHAHLPFVRHPEHERSLEEHWLFEAITETYIPLLQTFRAWQREGVGAPLTLTLTPTLCAMLQDPFLQGRYRGYLQGVCELTEKELHRTLWEQSLRPLAEFYHGRLNTIREYYQTCGGSLLGEFQTLQDAGQIEIITSAATHALLPLLANHPPSLRAQIFVARDQYRSCFGRDPRGIWLPECAYVEGLDQVLREAGLQWFITDTHGVLHARPQPRYGIFAPILTPSGVAAFGRDRDSAKQVWSRHEGYPGDPRYRDFYRDIGFDLDLDYLQPYLPVGERRTFTGIKYCRITGNGNHKAPYSRQEALAAADQHAGHFFTARIEQIDRLAEILGRPPMVLSPYDAELFGHWWYEGPEFLDFFVRKAAYDQDIFTLVTPSDYLRRQPVHQLATPAASSWGEAGYWSVWLNEKNQWIYPHLHAAQDRMTELARRFAGAPLATPVAGSNPSSLVQGLLPAMKPGAPELALSAIAHRALRQAGRELLLAQASDWPFILRAGTSTDYAGARVKDHLLHFTRLYDQLTSGSVDETWLRQIESTDNLFPDLECRYWL
jgi:1,4-alpha-glucan branching enzyme